MQTRTLIASALMTVVLVAAPFSIVTTPAVAAPPVGNTIAVCGCGAIFTPTAETQYIEYDGKRYACCSEGCHKMASKDEAKAGKSAKIKTANAISGARIPMQVANVIEITRDGARALCGCGATVTLGKSANYLEAGEKTFAACSKECRDYLAKDIAKATRMIEAKLAEHLHAH